MHIVFQREKIWLFYWITTAVLLTQAKNQIQLGNYRSLSIHPLRHRDNVFFLRSPDSPATRLQSRLSKEEYLFDY